MFAFLSLAFAADDAAALLARVDAANARGTDAHLVLQVAVTDRTGVASDRTLEIWQKGSAKRLVRFTAPARLAGTGLLVPDADTVYLYLPAYGKPRRVIGEQRGDSFMGTDFSMEDLSRLSWSDDYTAVLGEVIGEVATLNLTPKDRAAHRDASVRISVRRADDLVSQVEHVDASGAVTRRLTLSDFRVEGNRPLAHKLLVDDLVNAKHTAATVTLAEMDRGLTDDRFTLTELTRP